MQLIREDLVQSISNPQQIGIVSRLSSDSTSNPNLEVISENANKKDIDCIPSGIARVVWLKSQETNEDVTNLCVLDRSFILGDVVAALANPIGQTGIVMEISMSVDLELTNGEIVKGIDSQRLRHVSYNLFGKFELILSQVIL